MLRLNVLSGTRGGGPSGPPSFPQKSILSPRMNTKPGMQRPDICRSDRISLVNASPHPLKSPMLRRKAGDDGGVQRTPSARQTPKHSTAKTKRFWSHGRPADRQ